MIVTTPQDIALLDARRGAEMFRKVNVPVSVIYNLKKVKTLTLFAVFNQNFQIVSNSFIAIFFVF